MKIRNLVLSAAALALGVTAFNIGTQAQGPLYDKVIVNLPYTVTVGERVLEPGEYTIRQLPSQGNASRVLLMYKDDVKFETSAMTIPTLDNSTPEDTKVVLHHIGNDYYFDKIWIQGKNYGYEFILPDAVKARQQERMEPINVAAQYESVTDESATTAQDTTTSQESTVTEQRTETTTESQVAQQPAPQPEATTQQETYAQTQPQTQQQTQPEVETQTQARTQTQDMDRARTDTWRGASDRQADMPATAANWLMMLFGGGLLSGAGLALRRR